VRPADAARFGLSVQDIAAARTPRCWARPHRLFWKATGTVKHPVLANPSSVNRIATLRELPLRAANGTVVRLAQVAA